MVKSDTSWCVNCGMAGTTAGKEEDNGDGDEADDSVGPAAAGGAGVGVGCGGVCLD